MNVQRKAWDRELLKLTFKAAGEDGPGGFEGYGAVFGNVDRDNEIIARGAFAESLPAFIRDGFIADAHNWAKAIATVDDAMEDEYGLFIRCTFHSDEDSQAARVKMMERLERGKSAGLSVGFMPLERVYDEATGIRTITKADLMEVSSVTVPCNPLAQSVAAKGAGNLPATVREFEECLRDAGFSKSQAVAIASKGFAAGLRDADPDGPPATTPAIPADDQSADDAALYDQALMTCMTIAGVGQG